MNKTKSSIKKRFKLMSSGILKMSQSGKRHGMRKRAGRVIRNNRGYKNITLCEVRRVIRGMHGVGARKVRLRSNATLVKEYYAKICKMKNLEDLMETTAE